jgi:hypothetical protein
MNTTTKNDAPATTPKPTAADLMFALSQLLDVHGTKAVLNALGDAADACGSHTDKRTAETALHSVGETLRGMAKLAATAERIADITLAQGAIMLADNGDEAVSS